jgi:hypothetical protein
MTRETVPQHIWLHEVQTQAIAKGAPAEHVMALEPMCRRWYAAGEPIWMAVDSLVPTAKRRALEVRAESELSALRTACKPR